MSNQKQKPPVAVVLLCVIIVLLVIAVAMLAVLLLRQNTQQPEQTQPPGTTQALSQTEQTTEYQESNVPVVTDYIVLSYPMELQDQVTVTLTDLEDGQQLSFTTDFTGEALELFRFTMNRSGTQEQPLGVLQDESGDLTVSVYVPDYSNGTRTPEQYNQLTALQERVNDIIVQFYEDPRFVPEKR